MKMKKILFSLLLVSAILESCAATHFHSISTSLTPGEHFKKIIVHSDLENLDSRKTVEDAVVKQFQAIGVSATPSYAVFAQGSQDTWDIKKKTIQAAGFDAGLVVKVVNSTVEKTPKGFQGNDFNQTVANFTVANFEIETKLVGTTDFTAVWKAETGSREGMDDSGDFSLQKIMESYAITLVAELQSEGIVDAAMNLESIPR
jgi:hypothetical protein